MDQLRQWIVEREIGRGVRWLDEHRRLVEQFDPRDEHAPAFLGLLAQWIDAGYASPALIAPLVAMFPAGTRGWMKLGDYAHVRMAEAVIAMAEEEPDQAMERLRLVLELEGELGERGLIATANFWIARCLRKKGRYDDALSYALVSRQLAHDLGYPRVAAIVQVLEVWLYFQKGKPLEAVNMCGRRGPRWCSPTITSARQHRVRVRAHCRRGGRYQQALHHFDRAIEEYKQRDPSHPHLARTLVNAAFVKRLMALQIHRRIDERPARREVATRETRSQVDSLRRDAHDALVKAGEIYRRHGIHAGLGNVHVNLGHLFLDGGDLDLAAEQELTAFGMGEEKNDYILMARSRILQSMVENAKYDEQIEAPEGLAYHAHLAHDSHATGCRFRADAEPPADCAGYVWQGLTLCNEVFLDTEGREQARQYYDRAAELLRPEPQDYIWADLQTLKRKSVRTESLDATLLEWSQGVVGEKSFQQLAEEFAELIIPKVWEREGKKVARVAKRLSISPKKVRRVLASRGLIRNEKRGPAKEPSG